MPGTCREVPGTRRHVPGTVSEIVSPKAARQGDVNGDGLVNSSDLASLLVNWASYDPVGRADGDLDGDGDVDGSDLAVLLATWG